MACVRIPLQYSGLLWMFTPHLACCGARHLLRTSSAAVPGKHSPAGVALRAPALAHMGAIRAWPRSTVPHNYRLRKNFARISQACSSDFEHSIS